MTVLSSAEIAEQPPRKKLCLSASRQLQYKSYARSQQNSMASPLDQPVPDLKLFAIKFNCCSFFVSLYFYVKEPISLIMEPNFESYVMWYLLGYSFLMFTLPFVGYFSMKYFLSEILGIEGYQVIAISVIFTVIIVQLIIYCYVKQAFNEPVDQVNESDCNEEAKEMNDKKDQ